MRSKAIPANSRFNNFCIVKKGGRIRMIGGFYFDRSSLPPPLPPPPVKVMTTSDIFRGAEGSFSGPETSNIQ